MWTMYDTKQPGKFGDKQRPRESSLYSGLPLESSNCQFLVGSFHTTTQPACLAELRNNLGLHGFLPSSSFCGFFFLFFFFFFFMIRFAGVRGKKEE
jgi:hypothetical protein